MKALITALIFVATFSAAPVLAGVAAEQAAPHHGPGFVRALNLTPQERQQAKPIFRSSFHRLRGLELQARNGALGALSAAHRQQVEQIAGQTLDQLRALRQKQATGTSRPEHGRWRALRAQGKPIFEKSAQQIDALLTPQESQAVLAQLQSLQTQRRSIVESAFHQLRPILDAAQQQQLDGFASKMAARAARHHQADAGRFLLAVSMHGRHKNV